MGVLFDDANPDYFFGGPRFVSTTPLTLYAIHNTDNTSVFPQTLIAIGTSTDWWALIRGKHITTDGMRATTKNVITPFPVSAKSLDIATGWVASCAVFASASSRKIFTYNRIRGFASGVNTATRAITLTTGSNLIGIGTSIAQAFSGVISVIGIWNTALTDAQATGLVKGFCNPRLIQQKALVGYYSMKTLDGSGDLLNLKDGNTLTNVGSPSIAPGGPEFFPSDNHQYYKKVPKGLPDSVARMNRRKLTEGVF